MSVEPILTTTRLAWRTVTYIEKMKLQHQRGSQDDLCLKDAPVLVLMVERAFGFPCGPPGIRLPEVAGSANCKFACRRLRRLRRIRGHSGSAHRVQVIHDRERQLFASFRFHG